MRNQSAFGEYIEGSPAMNQPGITVLAGFPKMHRRGRGPRPASLDNLSAELLPPGPPLEAFVTQLFHLHPGSRNFFLENGKLRGLVHAATATELVYYEVRFKKGEQPRILEHMRETYAKVLRPLDVDKVGALRRAHDALLELSALAQADFEVKNVHLMVSEGAPDVELLVAAVKQSARGGQNLMSNLYNIYIY